MTEELDLLREVRPTTAGPTLDLAERERADLIGTISRDTSPWWARRRAAVRVPAAAAILAAAALGAVVLTRGSNPAWGSALVKVAQSAPRLLPTEPGWQVTRADQFNIDFGEMTFARPQRALDLSWQPAAAYTAIVDKFALEAGMTTSATIAGNDARVFRDRSGDAFNAVWQSGGYTVEVAGKASSIEDFMSTLRSFHEVDVNTWLSAMPASVVRPSRRADVISQMLADIPLPAHFNIAKLRSEDTARDRYQLGAQVSGAVGCAWIEQWLSAQKAGDDAREGEAISAMATSRNWAILHEMKAEGDYPEILWQYAATMTTKRPVLGKASVAESYQRALGCPIP